MPTNKLHIISFDVPYPADYGGAIDVYYKIKALAAVGIEIYLHCFEYGSRQRQPILEQLCTQVWYYPRLTGFKGISLRVPYIIYSRRNDELLRRLLQIDAPILFEGVHTSYYLNHPQLQNRFKAIRTHNIEHEYYKLLSQKEPGIIKKIYYQAESRLLHTYENKLQNAEAIFSLSKTDNAFFSAKYPHSIARFIAPFHPNKEIKSQTGNGDYCLYHGNLSHPENIEAVLFLVQHVANNIKIPLVIAGKNPCTRIINVCKTQPNCKLIANPDTIRMDELISNAHIHVLPTFQATGMKLKLLYALFNGRHVIVNNVMLHGTGLEGLCHIAEDEEGFAAAINQLSDITFSQGDIEKRILILSTDYNNAVNAEKIITSLPH